MRRRFEGFVVGRQTVRQEGGWKIARKSRTGRVNHFVPEAEIAEGLEMRPGVEVTFSAETREGRLHALYVRPKQPATMEDSMRKLKWGLITTLILVIVALVGVFKPHHHDPIRSWIVQVRAPVIMWSINQLTPTDIISDGVVRAAINPSRGHTAWAARAEVFRVNQCRIFSIGYEDPDETCDWALYYEGSNDPWARERTGTPSGIIDSFFPAARQTIYRIARNHLASPQNLRAMYLAKKGVIVDEFRRLGPEIQTHYLNELSRGIGSFTQFQNAAEAKIAREHYLVATATWVATLEGGSEEERRVAFEHHRAALGNLIAAVEDWHVFMFAGRRFAEGGDSLVAMYIEIMQDLRATLTR